MKLCGEPAPAAARQRPSHAPARRQRYRSWRAVWLGLILLAVAAGIGRAVLPWVLRDYVQRALERSPLYAGDIGQLKIRLWRGAYSIKNARISKTTGNIPVPFFAARRVDFALEWKALLRGKAVGRLLMEEPELNFVDAGREGERQTGADGPWLQMIRDLFPFQINSAVITKGSIHFRIYQAEAPVDVYLSQVEATIDNLSNIRDETNPLVATVQAAGLVMDQAKFEFKMVLDPFSYRPTFHLATRLLGLDVTRINELARTYGKFDFKRGWFDFVLEVDAKEGQITGYAKPLFRNLKVFSLTKDLKEDDALEFFWTALVHSTASVFKNHSRDQFGTLIPFRGDISGATTANLLATIGNLLRNAFVRAYLPRLESGLESVEGLQFEPPEFNDHLLVGDEA